MNLAPLLPEAQLLGILAQVQDNPWLRPLEFAEWFGSYKPYITVPIVLLVVFGLPFLLGWLWSKWLRMPNYSWRIGLILCAITASIVTILLGWPPKLGVDLKGGYIMIWQIDDRSQQGDFQLGGTGNLRDDTSTRGALIEKLKRRLNPDGLKEISIRPYGLNEIEIIVPETDKAEIDKLKRQLQEQGVLQFLIVAERGTDARLFEVAREQLTDPVKRRLRDVKGAGPEESGRWVKVGREDKTRQGVRPLRISHGWSEYLVRNASTGELMESRQIPNGEVAAAKYLEQAKIDDVEVLMKVDERYPVSGKDLQDGGVSSGLDENGFPSVHFNFKAESAGNMGGLTSTHLNRQLAIVLDDALLSAANIKDQITDRGRITGRFSQEEVDFVIRILKAGSLPAKLKEQPVYEDPSDPTLGAENIRQGAIAIAVSLALVFLFCLLYYRSAGVVACFALVLNILLTMGVMILFGATLTMPGLAGLVLTVGMAVDANVLIFERMREELEKGASLRMGIRNGYDRAMSTIIDSNLTTLLTAVILYVIGTDQLVGFAVTLTLGIIISMFTAIFCTRVIFEVWERTGFVRSLSFMKLLTKTNFDFVRYMGICVAASCILIAIGLAAAFYRGGGIFDIDLRGGSSIQFVLNQRMTAEEVRTYLDKAFEDQTYEGSRVDYTLKPVGATGPDGKHNTFRVDTIFPDTQIVQDLLEQHLQVDGTSLLKRHRVTFEPPVAAGDQGAGILRDESAFFTALKQETDGEAAKEESEGAAAAKSTQSKPEPSDAATPMVTTTVKFEDSAAMEVPIDRDALRTRIENAARDLNIESLNISIDHPDWNRDPAAQLSEWNVSLSTTTEEARQILERMQADLNTEPVWPASKKIGGQIAGDFVKIAIVALLVSLVGIVSYIWFRFQNVTWGFAAVLALVHDVLFMLAGIAVSYFLVQAIPDGFLGLTEFKIDLTVIAAFLTLIGFSINDTIVIFDRMREIKGKLPNINRQIVNDSINQTLSRSVLTFLTVFIVVIVLYAWGGPGIHAFAYAMLIGTFVGMYSTVFIASPFLLWMVSRQLEKKPA